MVTISHGMGGDTLFGWRRSWVMLSGHFVVEVFAGQCPACPAERNSLAAGNNAGFWVEGASKRVTFSDTVPLCDFLKILLEGNLS